MIKMYTASLWNPRGLLIFYPAILQVFILYYVIRKRSIIYPVEVRQRELPKWFTTHFRCFGSVTDTQAICVPMKVCIRL